MSSKVDITCCLACHQVLTDPRQLPCIHTFCLHCIETTGSSLKQGYTSSCPVCAAQFDVPYGGLENLPRNKFVEKLIDVKKVMSAVEDKTSGCEVCCAENGDEDAKVAEFYCMECTQKMCNQCGAMHRRMKATNKHKLLDLASGIRNEDLRELTTLAVNCCDQHPSEAIKVYCSDCRLAICMLCHLEQHNSHNCTDVTKVTNELRRRIKDDIHSLAGDVARCKVESLRIQRDKADFTKVSEQAKSQINEYADELKKLVDDETKKLLDKLSGVSDERRAEVNSVESALIRHQFSLESFIQYSEQLFDNGTACDVASSAEQLHARANQLQLFDITSYVHNITSADVIFTRSDFKTRIAGTNIIGEVLLQKGERVDSNQCTDAPGPVSGSVTRVEPPVSSSAAAVSPAKTIPTGTTTPDHLSTPSAQPVLGITSLDGSHLFVIRHKLPEIEVYETSSLNLERQISVPGLGSWPYGLAACRINQCLYVSDFVNNVIHRVDVSGSQTTRWSVPGGPSGLDVNTGTNVVVALTTALKIQIYSSQGSIITELSVPAELAGLSHVVQIGTSEEKFIVSHGTSSGQLQRLCIVEKGDGQESGGSDAEESSAPEKPNRRKKLMTTIRRHETKTMSVKPVAAADNQQKIGQAQVLLTFGGAPGGGERQLHAPKGLVVDKGGRILIADRDNNRVVMVDAALTRAQDVSEGLNIQGPRSIWLDESQDKLYVGEESGGRLIAFSFDPNGRK